MFVNYKTSNQELCLWDILKPCVLGSPLEGGVSPIGLGKVDKLPFFPGKGVEVESKGKDMTMG